MSPQLSDPHPSLVCKCLEQQQGSCGRAAESWGDGCGRCNREGRLGLQSCQLSNTDVIELTVGEPGRAMEDVCLSTGEFEHRPGKSRHSN
jgi:hypothetical protein